MSELLTPTSLGIKEDHANASMITDITELPITDYQDRQRGAL